MVGSRLVMRGDDLVWPTKRPWLAKGVILRHLVRGGGEGPGEIYFLQTGP